MRKHNEGYVLIYVLVVMLVMGLVATGVLTVSLNNYRSQQAAGQRMQELYEAEGLAEQLVAEIEAQTVSATVVEKTDKPESGEEELNLSGFKSGLISSCQRAGALRAANEIDGAIMGLYIPSDGSWPTAAVKPAWASAVTEYALIGAGNFYSVVDGELYLLQLEEESVVSDDSAAEAVRDLLSTRSTAILNDCTMDSSQCILPYRVTLSNGTSTIQMQLTVTIQMNASITKEEEIEEGGKTKIRFEVSYSASDISVTYDSYEISTGVGA